jgi:glucokinase
MSETTHQVPDEDSIRPAVAIGIDVGGTKIAAGLVRFPAGVVVERCVAPTGPERGPIAVLEAVAALAVTLRDRARAAGWPLVGIGVGVPELVDLQGRVRSGHTVAWQGLSVPDRLKTLGPVRVEADVRAAALAEARFGAGRPYRSFVYLTVGTGIGCTLVQDGRPYPGARGNALVLGSSPLTAECPHCGKELNPILEEVAAGPAMVSRYRRRCARVVSRAEEVLAAAAAGDPEAVHVATSGGAALGTSVGLLANVLDPEALIVGGGLGLAGGLYWDSFVASTRGHIWAEETRGLPILPAGLGTDAGLIGAATLQWRST